MFPTEGLVNPEAVLNPGVVEFFEIEQASKFFGWKFPIYLKYIEIYIS